MSTNSAAYRKRVESAVRILRTSTGINVPQAMILAQFSKNDIANETICRMIRCRFAEKPPTNIIVSNDAEVSLLTADSPATLPVSSVGSSLPTNPKPKRKQIRLTASAAQQNRVLDLEAKRHKSASHKAAVQLYNREKQKPNGMSARQVHAAITAQYEMCLSISTITLYTNQGLIDASPKKMGPVGSISATAYKFLCQAYSSIVPINQMNASTIVQTLDRRRRCKVVGGAVRCC